MSSNLERSKASEFDNDARHDSEGVKEAGCEAVDCIHLAHDKCQRPSDVHTAVKLNVL